MASAGHTGGSNRAGTALVATGRHVSLDLTRGELAMAAALETACG